MRRLLAVLPSALVVLSLAACGSGNNEAAPGTSGPAPEGIDGVEAYEIDDNSHVEGAVDYDQSPPFAGPHNPVWVNCGYYRSEVPDENAVHALEHGVVWITYDDVDDDTLDTLEGIADDESHVLVSEYPDQGSPLVLTAWNRQMAVDDVDDPRVEQFLDTYLLADTAPEPGASCEGGVG